MLIFRWTQFILDEDLEKIKEELKAVFGQEYVILPSYLEFCGEVAAGTRCDEEGDKNDVGRAEKV